MAVYEGVLRTVSSGPFLGRWSVREFIDIGENHIRNVALTEYHAQLLMDAIGQHVAVSTVGSRGMRPGRKAVMAIRTPERGIVKASSSSSFAISAFFQTIITWIAGIIAIFFVWGFAELLGAGDSTIANALLLGVAALFFFGPLVSAVRMSLARGALSPATVSRTDPEADRVDAVADPAPPIPIAVTAVAGWYDDSARPGHKRWWDGAAWGVGDDEQPVVASASEGPAAANAAPRADAPSAAGHERPATATAIPSALQSDGVVVADAPPAANPDSAASTKRFCENCGAERRPGGNFCANCGNA